jgi:serine/threonine protein kinase
MSDSNPLPPPRTLAQSPGVPTPGEDFGVTRTISPGPAAVSAGVTDGETRGFEMPMGRGESFARTGELVGGRYKLEREIARGGMGVVYAARDTRLGRDVAVKLLLDRYGPFSTTASRFVEEAQIAGQLQHAGVAPVHDLGTLDDGRPFLAMKLIKGYTLADLLKRKALTRERLVEVFAEIADTIAFAHSKGVIHRDLKPGNVMVGLFGEVQVMDWGLAKTLGTVAAERMAGFDPVTSASVSVVETDRTPDSATQAGSILGTPAYMPPEQAKGLLDQTDARADVFALGAILCEMLTGQPPYVGDTFDEIRAQSIMGLTGPAIERLAASGAEPDLVALASRCLDPNPANRPADGSDVRTLVAAHAASVSNRLRSAERETAAAAIRLTEQKKRRNLLLVSAGVIVAGLVGFSASKNVQNQQLTLQTAIAKWATEDAVRAKGQADRNAELARHRLDTALEAVEQVMVRVAGEKWAMKPELQNERREVLEEAVSFFRGLAAEDSQDPNVRRQTARANLFAGTAYISLGEYDKCREAVAASMELYRGLQKDDPLDTTFLRGEAECESLLGHADAIAARFSSALVHYESVLGVAKKAVSLDPEREENQITLIDAYSSLALFYSFQRPDLSKQYHTSALAIGETLLSRPSPGFRTRLGVTTALVNLAVSEINSNRDGAVAKFDRAEAQLAILDRMSPPNARSAEMLLSTKAGLAVYRGVMLVRARKVDEGIKYTKSGIDLLEAILKVQAKSFPFQIQHIQFQVIYADILTTAGKTSEALAVMENVRREQDVITRSQPQLTWIRDLGVLQRSNLIIYQLRERFDPEFEEHARQLLEANISSTTPAVIYNIACLYAQAATLGPAADKDRYAAKAVELLNRVLATSDFLSKASNVAHLDKDTDLDPLRERPDFQDFLKRARASVKPPAPKDEKSAPSVRP